jgi:LacI family kdg operon repressor
MDHVKQRVTIDDVAKQAGLSKTTISRYLNKKFDCMSEASKNKIAAVIEELQYRPNNMARGLKSSKSRLIGLIVADIGSPFSSIVAKGISDCCKRYGYDVLIAHTDNDAEKEQKYILSMLDQRVDGLIINSTCQITEFLKEIATRYVPIVLADRPTFPLCFDTVKSTDYAAVMETVQYLFAAGYQSVALFSEPIGNNGTRLLRHQAYDQACSEILHQTPQTFIVHVDEQQQVENFVQQFVDQNPNKKRAIFTVNGVTLVSVLNAIKNLELAIPDDVGICSFDNWDWTGLMGPGITAISQSSYQVGVECVKRLMFRLHRNKTAPPKLLELPTKLIIRGST